MTTTSDGSTASYYELPEGAKELQHLISHRDMNSQIGEIFRACYRYGMVSHSPKLRDAKKIKFYIDAEIERLESLALATFNEQVVMADQFGQQNQIEWPADDTRIEAIGQNGGDPHYDDLERAKRWAGAPEWANWRAGDRDGEHWYEEKPEWNEDTLAWAYTHKNKYKPFSGESVTTYLEPRP